MRAEPFPAITPARATQWRRPQLPVRLQAGWLVFAPAGLLVLFFAVPLLALVCRAVQSGHLLDSLQNPVVHDALRVSLTTSLLTVLLAMVIGTPLAYWLAHTEFPGKHALETLLDLPMVLPPVVAGIALLMAFGRRGVLGDVLGGAGMDIAFTARAVVLAQLFVFCPFYLRAARLGFQSVDTALEEAARMDGASGFRAFLSITLPLAAPAVLSGIVLCWTRALSEFGATMLFAGNLQGSTQTMSLAIMTTMNTNLYAALAISVVLLVLASGVLLAVRVLSRDGVQVS